jgi:hypothetical protein
MREALWPPELCVPRACPPPSCFFALLASRTRQRDRRGRAHGRQSAGCCRKLQRLVCCVTGWCCLFGCKKRDPCQTFDCTQGALGRLLGAACCKAETCVAVVGGNPLVLAAHELVCRVAGGWAFGTKHLRALVAVCWRHLRLLTHPLFLATRGGALVCVLCVATWLCFGLCVWGGGACVPLPCACLCLGHRSAPKCCGCCWTDREACCTAAHAMMLLWAQQVLTLVGCQLAGLTLSLQGFAGRGCPGGC